MELISSHRYKKCCLWPQGIWNLKCLVLFKMLIWDSNRGKSNLWLRAEELASWKTLLGRRVGKPSLDWNQLVFFESQQNNVQERNTLKL